jgi:hypothetical protein
MKDQAGNTIFDSSARVKPQNGLRRTTSRLATPPDMRQESRPSQLDSSSLDVPRPDLERIDTGVTRVHNPAIEQQGRGWLRARAVFRRPRVGRHPDLWHLCLGLYFLPTIIAIVRKMPNTGSVFVVNLFLGWTFIGWIVALVMAAGSAQPRAALQATSTASTAPLPPPPGTATAGPTFVHIGQRYRFGYSIDPPSYGIWDGENPGPPIERFPYNDHGKTEVSTSSAHSNPSR